MSETNFLAGLGLSKQIVDTLHKAGIKTKEDVMARRDKLAEVRGIGEQTLKALLAAIDPPASSQSKPPEPGLGAGDASEEGEGDRPRQGEVVVMCPYHDKQCTANKSEALFTRYYCPDPNCNFSQKVPRPDIVKQARRLRHREEDYSARADRP